MTYETYFKLSRFGFIAIILVLNIPGIRYFFASVTGTALFLIARPFGADFGDIVKQLFFIS